MHAGWQWTAFALLLNFSLISRGQDKESSAPPVPYTKLKSLSSALNGNWYLTGDNSHSKEKQRLPFLSVAIEVDGDVIHGEGHALVGCLDPWKQKGGGLFFTGRIASDGMFDATDDKYLSPIEISIHGSVPPPGATTWEGAYTLKFPEEWDCILEPFGTFTATKYSAFTGTWSGTVTGGKFETGATVTVQVTQGEPGQYSREGFAIPLGGQIRVSGSPCFSSGTATKTRDNLIGGDHFFLTFTMDDGAMVHVFGDRFRDEPNESTVRVDISVEGGQCNLTGGSGTLTLHE